MNLTRRAERRGRGRRGPLLPPEVPRWQSRSEAFDQAVIDAYAPLDSQWGSRLSHLDLAIDMIPRMHLRAGIILPEEIAADGPVPLGRYIPAGVDQSGNPTRPRLVVFRRPIERRAADRRELDILLKQVLIKLVAVHLGIAPMDVSDEWIEGYI